MIGVLTVDPILPIHLSAGKVERRFVLMCSSNTGILSSLFSSVASPGKNGVLIDLKIGILAWMYFNIFSLRDWVIELFC